MIRGSRPARGAGSVYETCPHRRSRESATSARSGTCTRVARPRGDRGERIPRKLALCGEASERTATSLVKCHTPKLVRLLGGVSSVFVRRVSIIASDQRGDAWLGECLPWTLCPTRRAGRDYGRAPAREPRRRAVRPKGDCVSVPTGPIRSIRARQTVAASAPDGERAADERVANDGCARQERGAGRPRGRAHRRAAPGPTTPSRPPCRACPSAYRSGTVTDHAGQRPQAWASLESAADDRASRKMSTPSTGTSAAAIMMPSWVSPRRE